MKAMIVEKIVIDDNCQTVSIDVGFEDFLATIKGFGISLGEDGIDVHFPSIYNLEERRNETVISFYREADTGAIIQFIKDYVFNENWLMMYLRKVSE